ncbi:MAG: RNase P subunit p30 family protein [Nanoarchaeota archaeon]
MHTDFILFDTKNNLSGSIKYKNVKISSLKNLNKNEIVIIEGNTINRDIIENKNVDILLSPEKNIKNDSMHHRNSGLNKVICNLARKNNIAIGLSFSELLNSNEKPILLGRMMQNVRLCRKFKVKMVLASFARNEYDLRSIDLLKAFALVVGMTPLEINKAFEHSNYLTKTTNNKVYK